MAKVKLRDLKEGMILAHHVRDRNGLMILAAGHRVTSRHLKNFGAWGIVEVVVREKKRRRLRNSLLGKNLENVSEEVKARVETLFRYVNKSHPAMAELKDLCALRKMQSSRENR